METRVTIVINTKACQFPLYLREYWSSESDKNDWISTPPKVINPHEIGNFEFAGNDRAGCIYSTQDDSLEEITIEMAFTCPRSSSNSAEGNARAGLQLYEDSGTPVTFTYRVLKDAKADWGSGSNESNPNTPTHVRRPTSVHSTKS